MTTSDGPGLTVSNTLTSAWQARIPFTPTWAAELPPHPGKSFVWRTGLADGTAADGADSLVIDVPTDAYPTLRYARWFNTNETTGVTTSRSRFQQQRLDVDADRERGHDRV